MNNSAQIAQAQAQAQQAQQQGNAAQAGYQQQATQYGQQYGQYQQQTDAARQAQQQYGQLLQGAGAGQNLYSTALGQAQQQYGFDPRSLATATQNLTQQQNAQAGLQAASQSSTGGYGLSGAQLGNMYSSQAAPLQAQVGSQSNVVGNLTNLANLAQTQAGAQATAGLTSEQTTAGSLKDQVSAAASQMESARQQMQNFETLAQQQGGLTAAQTASYQSIAQTYQSNATAYQSMLGANAAAYAAAGYSNAQTIGAQQANAQGALKSQYTMTPDSRGGFNYFQAGKPITREQYGQGLSQVSGAK